MRTGAISIFDPRDARSGVANKTIIDEVRAAVGRRTDKIQTSTETAAEPASQGILLGADAAGRPVRAFDIPSMPSSAQALRAVSALKETAQLIRKRGLATAVTPIVTGPLAALAAGDAVVLRFTNGVAIQAAL